MVVTLRAGNAHALAAVRSHIGGVNAHMDRPICVDQARILSGIAVDVGDMPMSRVRIGEEGEFVKETISVVILQSISGSGELRRKAQDGE